MLIRLTCLHPIESLKRHLPRTALPHDHAKAVYVSLVAVPLVGEHLRSHPLQQHRHKHTCSSVKYKHGICLWPCTVTLMGTTYNGSPQYILPDCVQHSTACHATGRHCQGASADRDRQEACSSTYLEGAQAASHGVHAMVQPAEAKVSHAHHVVLVNKQVATLQVPVGRHQTTACAQRPSVHGIGTHTAALGAAWQDMWTNSMSCTP